MIDHLKITLPVKPFSPVPCVPSIGAGETSNSTPADKPLSNGVPVCDSCGCSMSHSESDMFGCCSFCHREAVAYLSGDDSFYFKNNDYPL